MHERPRTPEERLKELGIALPRLQPAVGNYLRAKRHGELVFVSGHGSGKLIVGNAGGPEETTLSVEEALAGLITGKVGKDLSVEEGREAARSTALYMLASLRAEIGSLDRVHSILKVFGMVNCADGFTQTPAVIDGCSNLLVEIFGDDVGRHARSAVGMAELPLNIAVEIEMVVAVGDDD